MFYSSPSKHCWPWLPLTALSECIYCNRPSKPDRRYSDNVTPLCCFEVLLCCVVSKPCGPVLHCKACLQPGWESCSQVKLLNTQKNPICLTWTGCKRSFVTLFSLWERSQVEKALLKTWQRGKVDVNRMWKQELFQREAHLERRKNLSSALVLEGLK